MLDKLLQYHETPGADDFVAGVMRGVQHQQRLRRLILASTGIVGAAFGVAGAVMLSDSIGQIISQALSGKDAIYFGLTMLVSVGVMAWLLHDEISLSV